MTLGLAPINDPFTVLRGALVCAGAALLPDADHPSATIAHSIPIIGKAGANAVSTMTGGHRHGTHSLLGVVAILVLTYLLQFGVVSFDFWPWPIPLAGAIAATATTCFAVKVLGIVPSWSKAWLIGAAFGLLVATNTADDTQWVSLAIALGFVVHLAGDFITIGGLPLLWPWNPKPPKVLHGTPIRYFWMRNGYYAFPILGKTGSVFEFALAIGMAVYVVWVAGYFGNESLRSLGILI